MVDYTRIDKITNKIKAKEKDPAFSDFLLNFNRHPESNALVRATNEEAVKKALRNLLLTSKGERLYQPDVGADLNKILFEPISSMTTELLRERISEALAQEPRINEIQTVVIPNELNNSYEVGIILEVINREEPISVNLTLFRVR